MNDNELLISDAEQERRDKREIAEQLLVERAKTREMSQLLGAAMTVVAFFLAAFAIWIMVAAVLTPSADEQSHQLRMILVGVGSVIIFLGFLMTMLALLTKAVAD